jgi:lipopolysaccharide transport system permease protein
MSETSVTVISAERHERIRQFLQDLWEYRELFYTFLERDLKVRYKQTALGVIWVVLQPLVTTFAYVLVFGKLARMPSDGLPYMLFYFAANVPWNAFARELNGSAMSVEGNAHLISKVYFPRIIIPGAVVCASLVDFSIGWLALNIIALCLHSWHWQLVAITPLLLLIQWCTALGFGLALAALNVQYRDVKQVIGFLTQLFMLVTPVIYPFSRLPWWAQSLAFLNPMAAVVTSYRSALQGAAFDWQLIGMSLATALLYLSAGFCFFRKREARFADLL